MLRLRKQRGQAAIEFVVIVIVVLFFFLSGFQITQFDAQKKKGAIDRALFLTKAISSSPLFAKEDSVFDDGKLTALATMGNACQDLEKFFGKEWFLELSILDGTDVISPCNSNTYPDCNYWSFCTKNQNSVSFDLPVNVYRNIGTILSTGILPRTDIAVLKVGVYVS